jgi:hypothetical protein
MSTGERTRYYQQRPRRVPPEFAQDEHLEECSELAALLLYRLISLADDQGRQSGSATSVRARAFPLRDGISKRRGQSALAELVQAGFLLHYEIDGRWYLQVVRWWDLQGRWGERRRYPSQYPAPPGWVYDWVTAGIDTDELRAPGAQSADELPPPAPLAPASTPSFPGSIPGHYLEPGRHEGPEAVGAIVDRAMPKRLTDAEAMELGAVLAAEEQRRSGTRR